MQRMLALSEPTSIDVQGSESDGIIERFENTWITACQRVSSGFGPGTIVGGFNGCSTTPSSTKLTNGSQARTEDLRCSRCW